MGHQFMSSRPRLGSTVAAIIITVALVAPALGAEPDLDRFRAEIDACLARLGPGSNGVVGWVG